MQKSLSRKKDSRKSLLRNLATSLILYEQIKTTRAKATQVKPIVEHLITIGKKNDVNARRRLLSYLFDKKAVDKVFDIYIKRFEGMTSGFVKSYYLGNRLGDSAQLVLLKFQEGKKINIDEVIKENDGKKQVRKKTASKNTISTKKVAKTKKTK